MSRGTDTPRVSGGSLSMIMTECAVSRSATEEAGGDDGDDTVHSSAFSTLFSSASAGLPKTAFHICVWMSMSAGKNRVSRLGVFEAASVRQIMSSKIRTPHR
jgi:hypothetical protein